MTKQHEQNFLKLPIFLKGSAVILFFLAFFVYYFLYVKIGVLGSIYYALLIFLGDVKAPVELGITIEDTKSILLPFQININTFEIHQITWQSIYIISFFGLLITVSSAIQIFVKEKILKTKRTEITKGNHIILFGLTEDNKIYIESEMAINDFKKILVIENNHANPYIYSLYEKNIPVDIADGTDLNHLKTLGIDKCKHMVIATDNDMTNLEIASQVFTLNTKNIQSIPIYLKLEDRSLRLFHKSNGLFENNNKKIKNNIKLFSLYADSARELFSNHNIAGDSTNVIHSQQDFGIVIIGNTKLAHEIIFQACIMGQLPNCNHLTIHCIDEDGNSFKNEIELNFPKINNIPTVDLVYYSYSHNSIKMYEENFWHNNITNVIICKNNEQENIDIASNLSNITYIKQLAENQLTTKILIAMFNSYTLSNSLKNNNGIFKNFFVFGRKHDINHKKYLIDEERDAMAKAVNYIYNFAKYTIDNDQFIFHNLEFNEKDYQEKWSELSYFDKESNRSVADHILTKLQYLNLKIVKCEDNKVNCKDLWIYNQQIFNSLTFDTYLLAQNEHNRWNAFHYLNGYERIDFVTNEIKKKMKLKYEAMKVHPCLIDNYEFFYQNEEKFIALGYNQKQFVAYDYMINNHIPFIISLAKLKFE